MTKTIIFDYGGVLGNDSDEWKTTFEKILVVSGLSSQKVRVIAKKYWTEINLGRSNLDVIWKEVCKNSKNNFEVSELQKFYESGVSINENVLMFAKDLKKKGFDIVILSNESKEGMKAKIEKFKLKKIFSKIYCSAFLGMVKPDKKIFNYVLKDLNLKSKEVIFIDDREENIDSAEKLGIKSILFKDLNKLKKDIELII